MTRPPAPVLNFFARFLENPDGNLRDFLAALLDLEVSRAQYNLLSEPPLFEPDEDYRSDIATAERALTLARGNRVLEPEQTGLRFLWLTLLGHRLAVERDLVVGGVKALAHVAAARLGLPEKETEAWSEDQLFRRYTQTVLREEWDYVGIQFRYPRSAWPPEER